MDRSIFAIGGLGFSILYPTPQLDDFFVGLCGKDSPVVGLIPTASGDPAERSEAFSLLCSRRGYSPQVISLFRRGEMSLREEVERCDVIFVGGGNTWNMLQLWRAWGLDELLREAYEKGVPLGGVSAGANCWFEQCSTDSFGPQLDVMDSLGWLEGSFCPHYDGEANRRPTLERFMQEGRLKPGIACDEGVGVLYRNETVVEAVCGLSTGHAYSVALGEEGLEENLLPEKRLV